MNFTRIVFLFYLLWLVCSGCHKEKPLTVADRLEIVRELQLEGEKHLFRWEDFNDYKFEIFKNLYLATDDPAWINAPIQYYNPSKITFSKEDILTGSLKGRENTSGIDMNDDIRRNYAVFSRDCAMSVTFVKYSYIDNEGHKAPLLLWTGIIVWVKRDGKWRIMHFHTSLEKDYSLENYSSFYE